MKQDSFVSRHAAEWQALERWFNAQDRGVPRTRRRQPPLPGEITDFDFPARHRRLCQQLAIARSRGYSPLVTQQLQDLVQRGDRLLYRPPAPRWRQVLDYVLAGFPRLVRANAAYMWMAAALFYVPLLGMFVALPLHPELILSVSDPVAVRLGWAGGAGVWGGGALRPIGSSPKGSSGPWTPTSSSAPS